MQETQVWSPDGEDPLEKEMTTHSSILVWTIPCTEEPGGLESMGSQRIRHDWATNTFTKGLRVDYFYRLNWTEPNRVSETPQYTRERTRVKEEDDFFVLLYKYFDPAGPLKGVLRISQSSLDHTLKTAAVQ